MIAAATDGNIFFASSYLNIFTLDFDNKVMIDLSNYYLDKSNNNMFNQIELSSQPFRMNNKFWGKYVTLYIPSVAYESQQRLNNHAKIIYSF